MHSCQHVQWYLSCPCSCRSAPLLVSFTSSNDSASSSQTHHEGLLQPGAHSPARFHAHPLGLPTAVRGACFQPSAASEKQTFLFPWKWSKERFITLSTSTGCLVPGLSLGIARVGCQQAAAQPIQSRQGGRYPTRCRSYRAALRGRRWQIPLQMGQSRVLWVPFVGTTRNAKYP